MGAVAGSRLLLAVLALVLGSKSSHAADTPSRLHPVGNHSLEDLWEAKQRVLKMDQMIHEKNEQRLSSLEAQAGREDTEVKTVKGRVDQIYRLVDNLTKAFNKHLEEARANQRRTQARLQRLDQSHSVHIRIPRTCSEYANPLLGHPEHTQNGVYRVRYKGYTLPVYCDMRSDGGGWMLVLANRGSQDWTLNNIRRRNSQTPGLDKEYSILDIADVMRSHSLKTHFEYRIEATGRGKWGGIWRAPIHYSLVGQNDTQTNVTMLKKFNNWRTTGRDTVRARVPWIDVRHPSALLTTRASNHGNWWGTLVTKANSPGWRYHGPFPWISAGYNLEDGKSLTKLSTLYYWIRL